MLFPEKKLILSFCDESGRWPFFYTQYPDEYEVQSFDLKRGEDVRLLPFLDRKVYGLLLAPVCTMFTVSGNGARAREKRDGTYEAKILDALALVDACLRAVAIYEPEGFWCLENPVGTLKNWIGPARFYFNPCDFGGWLDGPADAYEKKTGLWGKFNNPERRPVEPARVCSQGSWIQKLGGKSDKTKELRSRTPLAFARAFCEANR